MATVEVDGTNFNFRGFVPAAEPSFGLACMVFYRSFLRRYKEPGWRDIGRHLPLCGQTS